MEGGNTMDWLDGFGIFYIIGGVTDSPCIFYVIFTKETFSRQTV